MISARILCAAASLAMLATPVAAQASDTCPALRWTTLGTAGGPVPTPERGEPSNLLVAGENVILVDVGDGTANALARTGYSPGDVQHIFISHLHWDHVGGLAAVLGLRWMNNFSSNLTVYGPPGTAQVVEGVILSLRPQERVGFGTGAQVLDPSANIEVVELTDEQELAVGDVSIRARTNTHFDFSLEEVGTVSLSYRFDLGNRSITYSGDTGPSTALTELAQGSDMLVTEVIALEPLLETILATRPDMPPPVQAAMRQHLSTHHVDAAEVGRMAEAAGVDHVVLTHFAVPPGPLHESEAYLRDGVREYYSGPLDLARDLSSFDVGCGE